VRIKSDPVSKNLKNRGSLGIRAISFASQFRNRDNGIFAFVW
jgi:hypothetical protein